MSAFALPSIRAFSLAASVAVASSVCSAARGGSPDTDFFERKIRPVLVEHCYECHSGDSVKGGLRLDSRSPLLAGGDSGPAIVPGDAESSLLLAAIRYEAMEMPPEGKLDDHIIADFAAWIEAGAVDPRDDPPADTAGPASAEIDWSAAGEHWAFQPPQPRRLPSVNRPQWVRRPIDAFLLSQMESAGLEPNEPADRRTWLRRVSLDLTGLPPTYEEVEHFAGASSPQAYRDAVDRLLSSAHYGQRWARLWLDIARYAEDQAHIVGNNKELFYPNAHIYRDWVVDALNGDMPYDEFCRLQLAADLIEGEDSPNAAALGFIGLGPKYYRRGSPEVMADEWEDRVDTVTRGMLGLTVACARCHDHKYDPIPTEDYYAIAGVFAGTEMFNRPLSSDAERKGDGNSADPAEAMHVVREGKPRNLQVMIRGDAKNLGHEVERGFLRVLTGGEPRTFDDGSGRRQLADAIASSDNPLTARVIVNRIWGEYFGEPLVDTPSNFGLFGSTPTHSELLDDLAVRFMQNGWSLKWLHREITLSAAYRQSSRLDPHDVEVDPAGRLLSRFPRRRLSVEGWRDTLLAVSGSLDPRLGGPSIDPADPTEPRRTLYARVSRFQLDPFLASHDFPDPNVHSEGRRNTTTPLQKLFALNSDFIVDSAGRLSANTAESLTAEERIELLYRTVFARMPDEDEVGLGLDYLGDETDSPEQWTRYAQALLASNELLFVE